MALKSILANKMRSLLTMLGIIIGIASVITMIALVSGATSSITEMLEGMGTNLIGVSVFGRGSDTRTVDVDDFMAFGAENSDVIGGIAPMVQGNGVTAKSGNVSINPSSFFGTNGVYAAANNKELSAGRFINDDDTENRRKVAVVGQYIVNELYYGLNPVGQTIRLNGDSFEIVGVLEQTSTGEAQTGDDMVIIPYTTAMRFLKNTSINSYNIQGASSDTVDQAVVRIKAYLYDIFGNDDTFMVISQKEMLDEVNEMTGMMSMMLGGVAGISLLVGGIGIMNIMLVSVTERTREIGIRKAIGARRRDILSQFVIEAVVVSFMGGLIGVILGFLLSDALGTMADIVPVITTGTILLAFGFSTFIGVFFGYYPAAKASKLSPMEALRTD